MSREKQVFSDTMDVAHLWAHQKQDYARNSGDNFYFRGKSIYSYGSHFEIARIIEDKVCLFTSATYSNTTAKHIGCVKAAMPYDWKVFKVAKFHGPVKKGGWEEESITKNIENYASNIEDLVKKQKTARKVDYTQSIRNEAKELSDYVDYFKVSRLLPKHYKFLLETENVTNEMFLEKFGLVHNAKLKERQTKERKLAKETKQKIAEWLEGKHDKGYIMGYMKDQIYLRLVDEPFHNEEGKDLKFVCSGKVQTSKAIEIPASEAMKLYDGVRRIRESVLNEDLIDKFLEKQGLKTVGNWNIDRVTKDGDIIAGCHKIPYSEIDRFATKYEWKNKAL